MMAETMCLDYTTERRTTMTRTTEDSTGAVIQKSGAAPVGIINARDGIQGMSEERTTVCGAMPVRKEE